MSRTRRYAKQVMQEKNQPKKMTEENVKATTDGFANFSARLGVGANNMLSDSGYFLDTLTRNRIKLEAMYRGSWIVGAIVDGIAQDMVREGIEIKGDLPPDEIQSIQVSLKRMKVWKALSKGIKWGRLYGGALGFINIDGQDPSTPLRFDTVGKDQFLGLRIYDRWELQPDLQNLVNGGPDDGLPEYYTVIGNGAVGKVESFTIHHSRAMRFIGIELPIMQAITEQLWGESVIERMYDRLVSFDMSTMGASSLVEKAYLRTVKVDKLREVLAAGGVAEENMLKMFDHMRFLQSNQGITLLDKEDQFETYSYSFAGLSDVLLQFGQQISGACGQPLVRLFGQSPAGLSSTGESDMRMYYDNISAAQEDMLRDGVFRLLKVVHASVLGKPADESFDFEFMPLWQVTQKEKADIALQVATTVASAFDRGIISQSTAMRELKQSSLNTGVFTNITDEEIEEAEMSPPDPGELYTEEPKQEGINAAF